MQNFLKLTKEKEYVLWRDWHVPLSGKYEHVNNGDSGQLVNQDGSRVIYGSSFMIQGADNVKDEIQYLGFTEDEEGSLHLSASVSQYNEFLTITITFADPLDEEWARSVIESVHRVAI